MPRKLTTLSLFHFCPYFLACSTIYIHASWANPGIVVIFTLTALGFASGISIPASVGYPNLISGMVSTLSLIACLLVSPLFWEFSTHMVIIGASSR